MDYNNSNAYSSTDFEDRLKDAGSGIAYKNEMNIIELVKGHYPNLNEKQLLVCEMVISAYWDLGETLYNDVVWYAATDYKKLFADEREVDDTVKQLIQKGILTTKIYFLPFKPPEGVPYCNPNTCERWLLRPKKFLDFSNHDIENQGFLIISNQFSAMVKEAFGPGRCE